MVLNETELAQAISTLEKENVDLNKVIQQLKSVLSTLDSRVASLEKGGVPAAASKPAESKPAPAKKDDDDDIDLFGSDEEDEEADKAREERAQAALAKKKPKPGVVAKSSVVLEIKPWDDETDLAEMEKAVRSVEMQGLLWGKSELRPVAFGVKKLQIVCVVEDDHVSIEELSEKIEAFEDFVQSVDVVAFNKI